MENIVIRPLQSSDVLELVLLWERTGLTRPSNDPKTDIALARDGENSDIFLGIKGEKIAASVMVGHDGHRGWVYYVSVDPAQQGKGFGRLMMDEAEKWLRLRKIPKMNLMVRAGNEAVLGFYNSIGYRSSEVVCLQKVMEKLRP